MTVALDDERLHPAGAELSWVETTRLEVCDAVSGLAGVIRLDVRPNQRASEVSLAFFLADDGFVTARHVTPGAVGESSVVAVEDARLETVEPLRRWRVEYDGPSHSLASAADTGRREAWLKSRLERLIVELDVTATADAVPGRDSFAQPVRVTGEVWVSGDRYVLDASGLRGRSWDSGLVPQRASRVALSFDDGGVVLAHATGQGDATEAVEGWTSIGGAVRPVRVLRVEREDAAPDAAPVRTIVLRHDGDEQRIAAELLHVAAMPGQAGGRSYELRLGVARVHWNGRTGHGFVEELE